MVKEIARYGTFKKRDAPNKDVVDVVDIVNKQVDEQPQPYNPDRWGSDIFNPFARYGI